MRGRGGPRVPAPVDEMEDLSVMYLEERYEEPRERFLTEARLGFSHQEEKHKPRKEDGSAAEGELKASVQVLSLREAKNMDEVRTSRVQTH